MLNAPISLAHPQAPYYSHSMSAVWHVKKSDGKRLGPVSLIELQAWARSGRIGPNDWLSVDGFNWREADSFSPLEMTCRVRQPGGRSLGPVHVRHLAELLLAGEVRPVDPAEDTRTGEKSAALKIVLRGLLDADVGGRTAESTDSTDQPAADQASVAAAADLQAELERQREENAQAQAQLVKERDELREQLRLVEEAAQMGRERAGELDEAALARMREAEAALQESLAENQRLKGDLDRLEQMARQWLERSKDSQDKQAKIERERDLAVQALEGVQGRYDALQSKWQKEKSGWSELQSKLDTTERLAAERIQRAEDQVKAWREKYEQLRQQPAPAPTSSPAETPISTLGKLDEAHIRLKVAISEKQRLEEECARLRRRLASYEQK